MERLTTERFERMEDFCTDKECLIYEYCKAIKKHNRLFDYEETGLMPEEIAALLADLKKADTDCSFCAHNAVSAPCEDTDNMCDQCTEDCICKTCRDNSNWVWCPPDKRVKHGKRT